MPGIRRIGSGKSFRYLDRHGHQVRNPEILRRIKRLAIPPAWRDVWISPDPDGHLQAVGRDARNRKQYRYHPHWREVRDSTKYHRLLAFAEVLPRIRQRVANDLEEPGLTRDKVLATVVRLLDITSIRVGNEEYARQNHSFGLTTLRNHHAEVSGEKIIFYFRGKSGKRHRINVQDRHLARIVKRLQDLPGYELFQYLDSAGEPHSIDSSDVNAYLREITEEDLTAKDFRTWNGTVLAVRALCDLKAAESNAELKRNIVHAVESVAGVLGNTVAVCRSCYIHPAVFEAYTAGRLPVIRKSSRRLKWFSAEERAVKAFLRRCSKLRRQAPLTLEKALKKSISAVKEP